MDLVSTCASWVVNLLIHDQSFWKYAKANVIHQRSKRLRWNVEFGPLIIRTCFIPASKRCMAKAIIYRAPFILSLSYRVLGTYYTPPLFPLTLCTHHIIVDNSSPSLNWATNEVLCVSWCSRQWQLFGRASNVNHIDIRSLGHSSDLEAPQKTSKLRGPQW